MAMPIDLIALGAALLSGLFGGVHCLAMCGGIATALPATARGSAFASALWLNLGRVFGYAAAGAIVGGLGGGLLRMARIDGLANALRTMVGAILILAALRLLFPTRFPALTHWGQHVWQVLQPLRQRVVPAKGPLRPFALGLFWGWLPCGLSTTLLLAAWFEASALHGGLLMLAFGLGTLPLMTGLSWSGAHFARQLALPAWRVSAAFFIAMAGAVTLAAPWLMRHPTAHALLSALGCRTLP
jgi:hypothetical protein